MQEVKKATSHFKGLKIAIMGCMVNGPGEMADADYGYIGGANGKISSHFMRHAPEPISFTNKYSEFPYIYLE